MGKPKRLNCGDVKSGDIIEFKYLTRVASTRGETISVKDINNGLEFDVHGDELIEAGYSTDRYIEEEEATMTKLAEILNRSRNLPFGIEFIKKDGTLRHLRGVLTDIDSFLGYTHVIDLDITEGNPNRQIDNRNILSIIIGGKKYSLPTKKKSTPKRKGKNE
jgi:hypothetical protein